MATDIQKPEQKAMSPRGTLRDLFAKQRPELSRLLPRGMSLDRLERIALTECVKNPKLLQCSSESWALAMQTCAAQGLLPDSGLGYMYLIPRENRKKGVLEVQAQRGYQGDIQLARNSGEIADIYAEVVYERDVFRVRKGLDRTIEHEPYMDADDPGALKAAYAVAKLKSGETAWVVLSRRDVERHKKSAQGTDRSDSPWNLHEAAMWRKTAIHDLVRWLPKSSENMEMIARGDNDETATIDTSAMVLPEPARPALEGVKDRLRSEAAGDPALGEPQLEGPIGEQVEACDHPEIPPSRLAATSSNKTLTCLKCGTEFQGEAAAETPAQDREPGSDDGDPAPVADVKAFVGKAAAQPGKARQGRLTE